MNVQIKISTQYESHKLHLPVTSMGQSNVSTITALWLKPHAFSPCNIENITWCLQAATLIVKQPNPISSFLIKAERLYGHCSTSPCFMNLYNLFSSTISTESVMPTQRNNFSWGRAWHLPWCHFRSREIFFNIFIFPDIFIFCTWLLCCLMLIFIILTAEGWCTKNNRKWRLDCEG